MQHSRSTSTANAAGELTEGVALKETEPFVIEPIPKLPAPAAGPFADLLEEARRLVGRTRATSSFCSLTAEHWQVPPTARDLQAALNTLIAYLKRNPPEQ